MPRSAQLVPLLAFLLAASAAAQSSPAPCTVIPQPDPCGSKPASDKKPAAADKFPFPGSSSAQPQSSAPSLTGVPTAPAPTPGALDPGVRPDKKFPFPGETAPAAPATPGSNSSSSADPDAAAAAAPDANAAPPPNAAPDPNAAPGLKDTGSEGQQTHRRLLHRVNPPGTKLQTPEEREAEDLDVAHFYMDSGDLAAAYARGKDAVTTQPDDPEAHLTLADIALKLNKRDEAIQHYQQCLKLDPTDKQAKASRKALARLQASR